MLHLRNFSLPLFNVPVEWLVIPTVLEVPIAKYVGYEHGDQRVP